MLSSKNPKGPTFTDRFLDAVTQIPLYTKEWTNYNPSDPGITILENLTAFTTLQQEAMNEITPQIRENLLKLTGLRPKQGRAARVLLCAGQHEKKMVLHANQQFWLDDLCFETNRTVTVYPYRLTGVFGKRNGIFYDYSYLCDREMPAPGYLFGEHPSALDSVYFAADGMPEAGEELIFYVTVVKRDNRNPFPMGGNNLFASLKWECYTQTGFEEIKVWDGTGCFLMDGEIKLRLPKTPPARCGELCGAPYVIRATLTRAEYDVCPKVAGVAGFLFEVWQKQTKAFYSAYPNGHHIRLSSHLAKDACFTILCKEKRRDSYHKYLPAPSPDAVGRYYDQSKEDENTVDIRFHGKRYGFEPKPQKNAVRIVFYTEEMASKYLLGRVIGYDNQVIALPVRHVVFQDFSILAVRENEEGEEIYDFVGPNQCGKDDLSYVLLEQEGKIVIKDAGAFIGAKLYIASLSEYRGEGGNIRAGCEFYVDKTLFYNPGAGTGGCYPEDDAGLAARFRRDIEMPYTAVTAADYEFLVKHIPKLCIQKVHAIADERQNLVKIAVKPDTDEELPVLSELYKKEIEVFLKERRLITTRLQIESPAYVRIHVHARIRIKRRYADTDCKERITEAVCRQIDYLHSDKNLGEALRIDEVFHAIEALECVERIYELSLHPHPAHLAQVKETEILPDYNCLCYPGILSLDIGTYE